MVLRTKPVYRKSMMNRLLNWMGLVDEGEPGLNSGYEPRSEPAGRRPQPRSQFRIVEDQQTAPAARGGRVAEPVPPYQRPAVISARGDADVIVRAPEQTVTSASYTEVVEAQGFDDVRKVADMLREQVPVVVNLKNLDPQTVRRLVDFLCGLVYALDGTIQKSTVGVLLVRPPRVTITRQELRRLASLELYDL